MAVAIVLLSLLAAAMTGCSTVPGHASRGDSPAATPDTVADSVPASTATEPAAATLIQQIARQVQSALSRQAPRVDTTLPLQSSAELQLDVGIVSFTTAPTVTSSAAAGSKEEMLATEVRFPLVRRAECRYLPFLLRQTLVRQADRADGSPWGVVRVIPKRHPSMELLIEGEILVSDGEQLQLRIVARDSSERTWLDRIYQHYPAQQAYQLSQHQRPLPGSDPFQPLFDQVAADLQLLRSQMGSTELSEIRQLARLRYGEQLSAGAFAEVFAAYYSQDEQGQLHLLRLPSRDDPMLGRVDRLRQYEYFFIDTADEQYANLFAQMQETYWRWRQYSRELALYMRDYRAREEGRSSGFRRGTLASMNEVYGDYEWYRLQQRELEELASGFNNEVLPTVLGLDDDVVQLNGDLENQYQQWRSILAEIFRLEQGEF